jgi:hypothetical protein
MRRSGAWRSAAERRQANRENGSAPVPFVNQVALMLENDCLLYERSSLSAT